METTGHSANKQVVALDTETTGLPGRKRIYVTQLALVEQGEDPVTCMVKIPADAEYSKETMDLTGLTREKLAAEGVDPVRMYERLIYRMDTDWADKVFVAHNAPFDRARLADDADVYLGNWAGDIVRGLEWFCTRKAAEKVWGRIPRKSDMMGNSLNEVCYKLGIPFDPDAAHRADYDAIKALEVYNALQGLSYSDRVKLANQKFKKGDDKVGGTP